MFWSHSVIHHHRTFRQNFVTQFRGAEEQAAVDSTLSAGELRAAQSTRYGLTITLASFPYYLGPPSIVLLGVMQFGGLAALAGFMMLMLPPLLSMFIHPLIHMRRQDIEQRGGLLAAIMRTRWAQFIVRYHWLHHRYPNCNFNLLPLGDYLLGAYRRASPADYDAMRQEEIAID